MGLLAKIKEDVKKSGGSKGKFFYVREGEKVRLRFLQDLEDGLELIFHDSFSAGVNVPCQEVFGRECSYCTDESLRTRSQYIWSIYNYDANEVQLFMYPVNQCSPLPPLIALFENYGTITDRDYIVSTQGKMTNKSYSLIPMDKVKFRNEKANAMSKSAVLKLVNSAYPDEKNINGDIDIPEDLPFNTPSQSTDTKEEVKNYAGMKPQDLYKLCVERKIEADKKKQAQYYITILEEDDAAKNAWGDLHTQEDEWAEDAEETPFD